MVWITTRSPGLALAENSRGSSIVIWDSSDKCDEPGVVFLWNGYEEDGAHSLLRYVDAHAERLRRKYLSWIHDLGESQIGGKRLVDRLVLANGLSYWWLTAFVEQSPWKLPSIIDALRLLALEEIIKAQRPRNVRLVSVNRHLHKAVRSLCQNLGIECDWTSLPRKPFWHRSARELYRALPQPVQGLCSLFRHLYLRWALRQTDRSEWFAGDRALLICSYFIHLDQDSCSNGHFHSRQWEELPGILREKGYAVNWLQHYLESSVVPNTSVARNWVSRFNREQHAQGFHVFLDGYLSWRIVLRILRTWIWLMRVRLQLGDIDQVFQPRDSSCTFWPIMQRDWRAALGGSAAMSNLLWAELFDAAMRDLPTQRVGFYLCENQAWERAFIHSWRKYGHGRLIAVAHSTVRFWDLRYFQDPRTLRSRSACALPKPDFVALNGPAAVTSFLHGDFPRESIVECEALRYGYLQALPERPAFDDVSERRTRVLVLGDSSRLNTDKLLKLLQVASAGSHLHSTISYTIKPHPNYQVKAGDFPTLRLAIVNDPLARILGDFDIACSCNTTSAAVDAYLAGLPVVVVFEDTELNFSPLRGREGVRFAATGHELAEALQQITSYTAASTGLQEMFFIDPEYPRWRRLLDLLEKKPVADE